MSFAKAKRVRAERAKALRERLAANRETQTSASKSALQCLVGEGSSEGLDELEVIDSTEIPFKIHPSHSGLIACGGFVACSKCGRCPSEATRKNKLTAQCRERVPPGTRGRLARLAQGRHPWKDGCLWPSGERTPQPFLVQNGSNN